MSASSINSLLYANRGIVFADDHNNPAIPHYLASKMKNLADAGVKVLFVEMFNNPQPDWLSAYNKGDNGAARQSMEHWLGTECNQYPPRTYKDYMVMFDTAREQKITIVGIEPSRRNVFTGIKDSNTAWESTINTYLNNHKEIKKFAVYGGRLHTHLANQLSEASECDQAEGIDKLLGIPCVTFFTTSNHNITETLSQTSDLDSNTFSLALPKRLHRTKTEKGAPITF